MIHVIRVVLYSVLNFLVCAAEVRRLVHRLPELLRLLPELIKIDFALFQREDKLFEGVAWVHKRAVIPLRVGTGPAATSQATRGLAVPQVVVGDPARGAGRVCPGSVVDDVVLSGAVRVRRQILSQVLVMR